MSFRSQVKRSPLPRHDVEPSSRTRPRCAASGGRHVAPLAQHRPPVRRTEPLTLWKATRRRAIAGSSTCPESARTSWH